MRSPRDERRNCGACGQRVPFANAAAECTAGLRLRRATWLAGRRRQRGQRLRGRPHHQHSSTVVPSTTPAPCRAASTACRSAARSRASPTTSNCADGPGGQPLRHLPRARGRGDPPLEPIAWRRPVVVVQRVSSAETNTSSSRLSADNATVRDQRGRAQDDGGPRRALAHRGRRRRVAAAPHHPQRAHQHHHRWPA